MCNEQKCECTKEVKFKDGDWAWSHRAGWGLVKRIPPTSCSAAGIEHCHSTYTNTGRFMTSDLHPSLYTVEQAAKLGHYPPKEKILRDFWINPPSEWPRYVSELGFNHHAQCYNACVSESEIPGAIKIQILVEK